VLLLHGLLQASGTFCVNDESSLAFFLCKSGYDVWLGNNRGYFKPEHKFLKPSNPKFWAWNLRQMGCLDIPAMVNYVCTQTGRKKVSSPATMLNTDRPGRPFSRNNPILPSTRKRSSPTYGGIAVMSRRSRTSCIRWNSTWPISIRLCQSHDYKVISSLLWNTFFHPFDDDNPCYYARTPVRLARISCVQLSIHMDRFMLGTSSTEPFLSILTPLCEVRVYALVARTRYIPEFHN
jgi:hypothetical protein